MLQRNGRVGASVVELLVSVSAVGVLAVVLLPILQQTKSDDAEAKCLSNLRSIAVAVHSYAADDRNELIIPIHPKMIEPSTKPYWQTVHAYSYGGRSATHTLRIGPNEAVQLNNVPGWGRGTPGAAYAVNTRPLNNYLYRPEKGFEEGTDLAIFHCPADTGYPKSKLIDGVPRANAKRPCYNILGSSYPANMHALYRENGEALSLGPWGQHASWLANPARLVVFAEPLLFEMARQTSVDAKEARQLKGWHGDALMSNAAYADGHAQAVRKLQRTSLTGEELTQLGVSEPNASLLLRGERWVLDNYPTPGTRIFGQWEDIKDFEAYRHEQWPFVKVKDAMKVPEAEKKEP
ncbi:MAG: hypothetical protein PVJ57_15595 [Phycisphaerae bacterium]|jgi:prepilin-type processing-associated H-X9-DG protein